MRDAESGFQQHLKDHQASTFPATPVGKGGMKAQASGVHMDMPKQGQITESQNGLGGKEP